MIHLYTAFGLTLLGFLLCCAALLFVKPPEKGELLAINAHYESEYKVSRFFMVLTMLVLLGNVIYLAYRIAVRLGVL